MFAELRAGTNVLPSPPEVGGAGPGASLSTSYAYNVDKQSTQVTQPGSQQVTSSYDSAGWLSAVTHSFGSIGYGYNAATRMLQTVATLAQEMKLFTTHAGERSS